MITQMAFVWVRALDIINDFGSTNMYTHSEGLSLAATFAVSDITELHISREFPYAAAVEHQHVLADKPSWICTG
jgi:hypothetical protein